MKPKNAQVFVCLGLMLLLSGCWKKPADQAKLSGTGFDSVSQNDELTQLPQSATAPGSTANQQSAVEVLPIETSPVTQGVVPAPPANPPAAFTKSSAVVTAASTASSRDKDIQTALKNAGLYNGPIDGKIGRGSKKAIEAFQAKSGLKVDGKVGPKTWAALQPYLNGASASPATASSATASTAQNTPSD